ncbi:hypothetical protein [Cyanothece sp. BG0011]|uniref:hypothetical protein n=1 Tax=Cyanothece sp. BG0011 TaxID=2082950 RepID=UPI000D1E801D|nr:hypothetical protein [Cyanothece sp. BG0011]
MQKLIVTSLASTVLMMGMMPQTQAQVRVVPRPSVEPIRPVEIRKPSVVPNNSGNLAAPDSGPNTAIGDGDTCSGVSGCNDFIAECIGGGGDYVPIEHNDKGQPTAGSCDMS